MEEQVEPAPSLDAVVDNAPIDAEAVAGTATQAPSVPDSSIIADRVNQTLSQVESINQRRAQEAEYARLQDEVKALRALSGTGAPDQQKYDEVSGQIKEADDGQSTLMKKLQGELAEIRNSHETLQSRLQERQRQAEYNEVSGKVTTWVTENAEHFPLLNEIGQQGLVFQKMNNMRLPGGHMMSEAQAAREVETELMAIVERCAPRLGYTKGQVKQEREDQVSINSAMNIGDPIDRDTLSDDDHLKYLLREYQGQ